MTAYKDGLEDVIAARSAICRVDGEAGRLYYRGYEVADLVRVASFTSGTGVAPVWLLDRLEPGNAHNMPRAIRIAA